MPHDYREEEGDDEDEDITKYESEIPPTPSHLLAEIPQPGTWETWRDPAWKKYALKMDVQFDEILSYHYKLVEAIPTDDELLREVEEIVKKAWSLRLEYTLRYSEFMEDPKLSREHCRKFATQLRELQQFHLMTAFDIRLKTINRNQEKSRRIFDLQKQWMHGRDMGPRIDVTLVTDDEVEPVPSQQPYYPAPQRHVHPHPAHIAHQPHGAPGHPRHMQPQPHIQQQRIPKQQTQPQQMQPRHHTGSSSPQPQQQMVQRQHTQLQVTQMRYQPRTPSPLSQTLNAVTASTSTSQASSVPPSPSLPPSVATSSGTQTGTPTPPTPVASTSTSTSQAQAS